MEGMGEIEAEERQLVWGCGKKKRRRMLGEEEGQIGQILRDFIGKHEREWTHSRNRRVFL